MDWITQNGESGLRHSDTFLTSRGMRTSQMGLMSRRPVYSAAPCRSSCSNPRVRTYFRPYDALFSAVPDPPGERRIQWTMPSPSNQWYRLAPSSGSCAGLGPLRRYTPSSPRGKTPSTTRSSTTHSPTTGAKLPFNGGLSLASAHAGGALRARHLSLSSETSSAKLSRSTSTVLGEVEARCRDARLHRCCCRDVVLAPLRGTEGTARAAAAADIEQCRREDVNRAGRTLASR